MVADRFRFTQERVARAAIRSGRDPDAVKILGVTKGVVPAQIQESVKLGLTRFGENRVQEAREKISAIPHPGLQWHMIGHLQTNKAGVALELFHQIDSIDSVHLAQRVASLVRERLAGNADRAFPILLQVNTSQESTKFGFDTSTVDAAVNTITAIPELAIRGLMTIGPTTTVTEQVRTAFRSLRTLRERLSSRYPETTWEVLSMGMSNDFEIAIEEGATEVRLGSILFGPR